MSDASALPTGRFGPAESGGSGRAGPDPRRVAFAALVAVLALGVLAMGTAGSLVLYGQSEMGQLSVGGRQDVGAPVVDERGEDVEELAGVVNILAVGSDSREGLTDEQLTELGTERADGLRTDTIMLVQLDADRDEVSVLSFPRDLLVTRCDGTRGRINAAYGIGEQDGRGGPTCLVETVTDATGVPVHHFVEVDFAGFIDVVDALGGVSMWLDEPLADAHAGVDLPAGCVDMDGTTALGYVRSRKADGEGDFGRIARQQQFLRTVVDEAASVGTLINVPRLFSLVGSAARAVDADEDLTINQMRRLALSMREVESDAFHVYTVPGRNERVNGAWMVVADERAERLYAAFREASDVPPEVASGEVTVADVPPLRLHNGTSRDGLAASARTALADEGFEVDEVGDAPTPGVEATHVVFPAELRAEAQLVADALGGAKLEPGDVDDPLTVVLGADYGDDGIDSVEEPTEPSPTTTPAPEPTPTPESDDAGRRRC